MLDFMPNKSNVVRNSNGKNSSSSQCWIFKKIDASEDNLDILDVLEDSDQLDQAWLFLTMLDFIIVWLFLTMLDFDIPLNVGFL